MNFTFQNNEQHLSVVNYILIESYEISYLDMTQVLIFAQTTQGCQTKYEQCTKSTVNNPIPLINKLFYLSLSLQVTFIGNIFITNLYLYSKFGV